MTTDIARFTGEYRWLSNFYPAQVTLDSVTYPTVENAYQAAKEVPNKRGPFTSCSVAEAKRLGRRINNISRDWDKRKIRIMRLLLRQKFAPGSELAKKLIATGNVEIIEGNDHGDTFWGVCKGIGKNELGMLLMDIRAQLCATDT
jgi:ribA/ribD-fused uncharacterized protein